MDPTEQEQQQLKAQLQRNTILNGEQIQQQHPTNNIKNFRKKPYVKITEQPASKALRFRYECEGRSAGSIPGVNSTPENKTYPTIEIEGYKGRAVVVVSCITKDQPYRPHPHNLVGKEGCKKGVCTLEINPDTMRAVFSNLGIQCVKKKDIDAALKAREEIRVDPFKTGFSHRFQPSNIDLNSVRLCFQVFTESDQKGRFTQPLAPVVSEPIFDKKAMSDLVICRLCSCSATVLGNTQIILLCEKVAKDDISVRFYEEIDGEMIWEAFGEFQHTDVHKQTAIAFKTPRYRKIDITEPAKVFIQLKRSSDGIMSEALPFEYVPLDSGRQQFFDFRRNLKRKPDLDIFGEIISTERRESTQNENSKMVDLDTSTIEMLQKYLYLTTQNKTLLTPTTDTRVDFNINEKMSEMEKQLHQQTSQDQSYCLQEVQKILNSGQQNKSNQENQLLTMNTSEKIIEWINSNKLLELKNPYLNDYVETNSPEIIENTQASIVDSGDNSLNNLLKHVSELDGIYTDHFIQSDDFNSTLINELKSLESYVPATHYNLVDGGQTSVEMEDSFDDAATYNSLQIAFKNPISIPTGKMISVKPPVSNLEVDFEYDRYDTFELSPTSPSVAYSVLKPLASVQKVLTHFDRPLQNSSSIKTAQFSSCEDEKLPPLPPKRLRQHENSTENRFIEAGINYNLYQKSYRQTPIITMKTPDQSTPNKRMQQKLGTSSTLLKQNKLGFISKLFTLRKKKSDFNQTEDKSVRSKSASPSTVYKRNYYNSNDYNTVSLHSHESPQPKSFPIYPSKLEKKVSKQLGRSVSSISGKRPANLTANVVHIPLKGENLNSLLRNEEYSYARTFTLDRKTVSALQLANIPISDGNMELVAIADRQSLRNLCEGEFNVQLNSNFDLTEAEHFALYTSIPPQGTISEFDDASTYVYVDASEILMPEEVAEGLAAVNNLNSFL